jgi:hypothetical protein
MEHPHITDPQPILRALHATKALDPAATDLRRLVTQVSFDGIAHLRPDVGSQRPQLIDGAGSQDDLERHSGQIIARRPFSSNARADVPWRTVHVCRAGASHGIVLRLGQRLTGELVLPGSTRI